MNHTHQYPDISKPILAFIASSVGALDVFSKVVNILLMVCSLILMYLQIRDKIRPSEKNTHNTGDTGRRDAASIDGSDRS